MSDCVLDNPEIKDAQQRLRLAQFSVDHSADAIFWVRPDGRLMYINDQAARSLGYSRDELLSLRVHDIAPLLPRDGWEEAWAALREKRVLETESIHRRRDGSEYPVWVRASYYQDSEMTLSIACCRDITQKRAIERALRRAENKLSLLLSQGNGHADRTKLSAQRASLTPREQEVMDLLVAGRSVKQIAVELGVGFPTAARHRSRVLEKMNVSNDVELVRLVLSAG